MCESKKGKNSKHHEVPKVIEACLDRRDLREPRVPKGHLVRPVDQC